MQKMQFSGATLQVPTLPVNNKCPTPKSRALSPQNGGFVGVSRGLRNFSLS
jgi:hypothetical protein